MKLYHLLYLLSSLIALLYYLLYKFLLGHIGNLSLAECGAIKRNNSQWVANCTLYTIPNQVEDYDSLSWILSLSTITSLGGCVLVDILGSSVSILVKLLQNCSSWSDEKNKQIRIHKCDCLIRIYIFIQFMNIYRLLPLYTILVPQRILIFRRHNVQVPLRLPGLPHIIVSFGG